MPDTIKQDYFEKEKEILATILFEESLWKYARILSPSIFASEEARLVASYIQEALEQGATRYDVISGLYFRYSSIMSQIASSSLMGKDALLKSIGIVEQVALKSRLAQILEEFLNQVRTTEIPPKDLAKNLRTSVDILLASSQEEEMLSVHDHLDNFFEYLYLVKQGKKNILPTPWKGLNELLHGGYDKNMLHIIAGFTSHGKTALATHLALHIAQTNPEIDVYFVSAEMPRQLMISRILSTLVEDYYAWFLKDPSKLTDEKIEEYRKLATEVIPTNFFFLGTDDQFDFAVESIINHIVRNRDKRDREAVVFVDYLQLLSVSSKPGENDATRIARITREFVRATNQFSFTAFLLSQFRRKQKDETISKALLKGSSAIEQDAATILLMEKDKEPIDCGEGIPGHNRCFKVKIILDKNRTGELGTRYLKFDGWRMRFEDLIDEDFDDI